MNLKLLAVFVLLLFSVSSALGTLDVISNYVDTFEQNTNQSERVKNLAYYNYSVDIVNDYNISIFNTTSVEGLEKFLEYSQIDKNEHDINCYTCVNFSLDLIKELEYYGFNTSNSILNYGINGNHNIVAVKLGGKVVFVEPQEDDIIRFDELFNYYNGSYQSIIIYDLISPTSTTMSFNNWYPDYLHEIFEVENRRYYI